MAFQDVVMAYQGSLIWILLFQTIFWSYLLFVGKAVSSVFPTLNRGDQAYWSSCVTSIVHAFIVFSYSLYAGISGGLFISDDLRLATPESAAALSVFLAYMTHDMVLITLYRKEWPGFTLFLIHHLACSCVADFIAHGWSHNLGLAILLFEGAAPFVNLRWLLSAMKLQHTRLYTINGVCLLLSWFIFRIVWATYVVAWIFRMRQQVFKLPWFSCYISVFGTAVLGYSFQWFWFMKILRGALKLFLPTNASKTKRLNVHVQVVSSQNPVKNYEGGNGGKKVT